MLSLRRVALRALTVPPTFSSAKFYSNIARSSIFSPAIRERQVILQLQRRFASDEVAKAEPEADKGEESLHGDNSIAASSKEKASESDKQPQSSFTSAIKDVANDAYNKAADAAGSLTFSARDSAPDAFGSASGSAQLRGDVPRFPPSNGVYVGNIVFDISSEELKEYFGKAGEVLHHDIARDARGLSRGFGYIEFATVEEATRAVEMFNQQVFAGRRLVVSYSKPKGLVEEGEHRPKNPPSRTLFVGNMAFNMSDRDLNALFSKIRNVIDVRVAIDRRTGQPRGFAHADFTDVESAARAYENLQGKVINGRALRVDYSVSTAQTGHLNQGSNE